MANTGARLKFSSEILRRLGEELNPSIERGVLELVKNAYDADARNCTIELQDTDSPGGTIIVTDDGDGMSLEQIRNGWLVLGRSQKAHDEPTRLGRTPAGSKGLGRLAALRMGTEAILTTRPKSQKIEHRLHIDWTRFSGTDSVSDVELTIESRPYKAASRFGTKIEIRNLAKHVGRMPVKRLAREILLLSDPFTERASSFSATLVTEEFDDLARLVENSYFDQADYHLTATLGRNGRATAVASDWRGRTLFNADHSELANGRKGAPYRCPRASFDLWAFILTKQNFATRQATVSEVRNWLQAFGGIHLYENELRVSPYGDEGNDWLQLNLRRARSPEERPSTNNSIGRVLLHDASEILVQKTDRAGYIETEVFHELRAFAGDALDWLGRKRTVLAERRRQAAKDIAAEKGVRARKRLDSAISKAPATARKKLEAAASQYQKARDREVETLRKEVLLYRTLGTAGISAATFAHESTGGPLKTIQLSVKVIQRRGKAALGAQYEKTIKEPAERIENAANTLAVLSDATLHLLAHEKRRLGRVDIHQVIRSVLVTYSSFTKSRNVRLHVELCAGSPYLQASEAAIESIVANLLANSLTALEAVSDRGIWIETTIDKMTFSMVFQDSGTGIDGVSVSEIWTPGITTRKGGTGLGLAIVKDTIVELGGHVSAQTTGEHGGAVFRIEIPILGH